MTTVSDKIATPPTLEEIRKIIIAEKEYWDDSPPEIGMAASGACCNIYAATFGLLAPWHPDPHPETPESNQPA